MYKDQSSMKNYMNLVCVVCTLQVHKNLNHRRLVKKYLSQGFWLSPHMYIFSKII